MQRKNSIIQYYYCLTVAYILSLAPRNADTAFSVWSDRLLLFAFVILQYAHILS